MQTAPEIVIEDIPIELEDGTNYGSSGSGSDSGSDCEQTMSQTDLLSELDVVVVYLNSRSQLFQYLAVRVQNYRYVGVVSPSGK